MLLLLLVYRTISFSIYSIKFVLTAIKSVFWGSGMRSEFQGSSRIARMSVKHGARRYYYNEERRYALWEVKEVMEV